MRTYDKRIANNAKILRRNQTPEERHLWYDFLSRFHPRFRRQQVVGLYIVDFYCVASHLAIELDGAQHYEPEGLAYDRQRTEYLEEKGIAVLRFTNREVKQNFEGVCVKIKQEVEKRSKNPPSAGLRPPPSPHAGQAGTRWH